MKFAYADPPYPGCAHLYKDHPDYAGEVDHADLIARLVREYPDGWALSTKETALRALLPICPADVRVGAWCKPFTHGGAGQSIQPAWEPVIYRTVRTGKRRSFRDVPRRSFLVQSPHRPDGGLGRGQRIPGEKPPRFCWWVFTLLGAEPGDEVHDLFPGSGSLAEAWSAWCGDWDRTGTLFDIAVDR